MKPLAFPLDLLNFVDRPISLRCTADRGLVQRLQALSVQALGGVLFTLILSQSSLVRSNPIVSDGSLPNPTIVKGSLITGGTQSGRNLFHSFDLFSVPAGEVTKFQPDSGIQNIITRVTGGSRSVIDGEIQAPGNFFLINPNGITFGTQSSLNIGGSFFATTAPILKFSDGKTFGSDRSIAPVLSVNVPIGIQWGKQSSDSIQNFGNLVVPEALTLIAPEIEFNQARATGQTLDIQAFNQLSLNRSDLTTSKGGNLSLQVGDLIADSSRITASHFVTSESNQPEKLTIQATNNIILNNLSSVEAKTFPGVPHAGNDIQISGKSIVLRNGSNITTQSLGNGNAGNITLNATDRIALLENRSGNLPNNTTISSGTFLGDKTRSGNISLNASEILIDNQALIQTSAITSSQQTGDIRIQASHSIEVNNSIISNFDLSNQPAGFITLEAPTVQILNGSWIENKVFDNPKGSEISIFARDRISISGKETLVRTETFGNGQGGNLRLKSNQIEIANGAIVSTDTKGSGRGGNLSVEGQDIQILDGGQLRSITSGDGNSGDIQVKASDRILVKGSGELELISSFLIDSTNSSTTSIRYIPVSQLPPGFDPNGAVMVNYPLYSPGSFIIPVRIYIESNEKYTGVKASSYSNGKSGNIDLQAPLIDIRNLSLISNSSISLGESAQILLQAKTINLDNSTIFSGSIRSKESGSITIMTDNLTSKVGNILASAIEGNGGVITLNIRDRLTLNQSNNITARAASLGRGGNITINNNNGFIIADANGNNDILATASQGQGGIIAIRSAGVFNLVSRQTQTLGNDLLASSDAGIQGTITLNRTQQEIQPITPKLSEAILDRSNYIMPSCPSIVRNNRLIITGQGGRTPTTSEMLNLLSLETTSSQERGSSSEKVLTEATHWERQADGTLALLPSPVANVPTLLARCAKAPIPD
jgi:filamentous hemagglutinin family protein